MLNTVNVTHFMSLEDQMPGKILCVEDNPQNMRLVRKMLSAGGYNIIEAPNGHTALRMAAEELPDLILMDINLPDIDGMEATQHLKSNSALAHIPVIALTANAMPGDRERFLEAGCDGYLSKPITRNELITLVEHFLPETQ
jgi:two-component system, cell cycle response regulator DivK